MKSFAFCAQIICAVSLWQSLHGIAHGAILHVPGDYPTIQAALDSLQSADTVQVAVGVYAEALQGPSLDFTIVGELNTDSLDQRAWIDPTSLPNSRHLTCLRIPQGTTAVLQRLGFRNGYAMHNNRAASLAGGVSSLGPRLTVRDCLFDSTYVGIEILGSVEVTACEFFNNRRYCVFSDSSVVVSNCLFRTTNGTASVYGKDSSRVADCRFTDSQSYLLRLLGRGLEVSNNHFGPTGPCWVMAVLITATGGCEIQGNVFDSCQSHPAQLVLHIDCEVAVQPFIEISGNLFADNSSPGQGLGGIDVNCMDEYLGSGDVLIENNIFFHNHSTTPLGNCIRTPFPARIFANRIVQCTPDSFPDISTGFEAYDTLLLRNNLFEPEGFAVSVIADARWNWWGHPTGPYNRDFNPAGQGGEISNAVLFEPWYPDTSFLETPLRTEPGVASYALRAFPNPFNASVTLKLEIPEPGIFKIELFDLLGRRVKELFVGPVAYEKTIHFDGGELASGIFYARAWQTTHNRPVATTKLVLMK